jgi:hypothetical protein
MEPNNKIKHPYKAPEGYFDTFESRLLQRIADKPNTKDLVVSYKRSNIKWWVAAAASVAILSVSSWWFFFYQQSPPNKMAKVEKAVPVILAPKVIDSTASTELTDIRESAMMESLLTDPPVVQEVGPPLINQEDKALALELEEAGLIVANVEDDLFDDIEI